MAGLGGISLHHYRPKVPNIGHGTILRTFQQIIATRTLALMREAQLESGRQLEKVKADIERDIGFEITLDERLLRIAPHVLRVFNADGTALIVPRFSSGFGVVPNHNALENLLNIANSPRGKMLAYGNLAQEFP